MLTLSEILDIVMLVILMLIRFGVVIWLFWELLKFQSRAVRRIRVLKEMKLDTGWNLIKLVIYDLVVLIMFCIVIWFFVRA